MLSVMLWMLTGASSLNVLAIGDSWIFMVSYYICWRVVVIIVD
jgi:hypothetical protein